MCDEELNLADTSAKFAGDSNRRLPAYRILASYFDLIKSVLRIMKKLENAYFTYVSHMKMWEV